MLTNIPATPPDAWITLQDEEQFADRPEIALLQGKLGKRFLGWRGFQGDFTLLIAPDALLEALTLLKAELQFDHLSFMSCAHWPEKPAEGFQLAYQLYSRDRAVWARITCYLPDEPGAHIPTVTGIYPGAEWHECEAYDLFGIRFDHHPHLRRLLTPGMYDEFPLRRDFPLEGQDLRDFQKRLIGQWNTEGRTDYQGSLADAWIDRHTT